MSNAIIQNNGELSLHNEIKNEVAEYISFLALHGKSKGTIKTYAAKLSSFVEWYKITPPTASTKDHLLHYRNFLIEKYASAKTINLFLTVLRGFYRWLFENDIIKSNPTAHLKNVADSAHVKKSALTCEELAPIFEYLRISFCATLLNCSYRFLSIEKLTVIFLVWVFKLFWIFHIF